MNDKAQERHTLGGAAVKWRWKLIYRADQQWNKSSAAPLTHDELLDRAKQSMKGEWYDKWAAGEDDPTAPD